MRIDEQPPTLYTQDQAYNDADILNTFDDDDWTYRPAIHQYGPTVYIINVYDNNNEYIGTW